MHGITTPKSFSEGFRCLSYHVKGKSTPRFEFDNSHPTTPHIYQIKIEFSYPIITDECLISSAHHGWLPSWRHPDTVQTFCFHHHQKLQVDNSLSLVNYL